MSRPPLSSKPPPPFSVLDLLQAVRRASLSDEHVWPQIILEELSFHGHGDVTSAQVRDGLTNAAHLGLLERKAEGYVLTGRARRILAGKEQLR